MKCVNIKLWDILGCFHYILNAPRIPDISGHATDTTKPHSNWFVYLKKDLHHHHHHQKQNS